jgi:hypothetical protein
MQVDGALHQLRRLDTQSLSQERQHLDGWPTLAGLKGSHQLLTDTSSKRHIFLSHPNLLSHVAKHFPDR